MTLGAGRMSGIYAILAAIVVVALFAVAAFLVRNAIVANAQFQRDLRTAQLDRSQLLRLQVDEETGERGYVATRAPIFLQPYDQARPMFAQVAVALERDVAALGISQPDVAEEIAVNRQWLREVAEPAISNPAFGASYPLQLRGKSLVDAFRAHDEAISDLLETAADQGEDRSSRLVSRILTWTLVAGSVLAAIFLFLAYVQQRLSRELEIQRRAYLEEKRVADALQEAFLRKELPDVARADLHGVYVPAGLEAKVGGDWYDAFDLGENRILFSIGDVAGHGIEAAVVMSRVRQAVLSVGVEEPDPAKVLERANEILLLQDRTMVTAVCGTIDLTSGAITVANAGHPAAILLRPSGEVVKLDASGPPLGSLDQTSYTSSSMLVEPGALLVLYTDGLIEYARDWDAGEARLLEAIHAAKRSGTADPAASILELIFGSEAPVDDVAIMTIAFREAEPGSDAQAADAGSASGRPLLDRSVRALIESIALPVELPITGLEASVAAVEAV